jgi:hypothetical protein
VLLVYGSRKNDRFPRDQDVIAWMEADQDALPIYVMWHYQYQRLRLLVDVEFEEIIFENEPARL